MLTPTQQKVPKEPILEEAELDFRPLEDCEEQLEEEEEEEEEGEPRETKETDTEAQRGAERKAGELEPFFNKYIL